MASVRYWLNCKFCFRYSVFDCLQILLFISLKDKENCVIPLFFGFWGLVFTDFIATRWIDYIYELKSRNVIILFFHMKVTLYIQKYI
jgi:hypothetical protein